MSKIFLLTVFMFVGLMQYSQAQMEMEDTILLEPITISDKMIKRVSYIATNYIDRAELQSTSIRDVGEFLRRIPNVSGIRRGGSAIDPVVRGYKYSQLNVIMNNGIKIEGGCPNRMDPVSSHIEAEDIENIEIIKGPFSMKYGPSFGGLINLVSAFPKPYEKFEIHTNAMLGMESNWNGKKIHGSVFGGNRTVFFHVAGGYRNYGNYESGSREGIDTVYSSAFMKYNHSAKFGLSFSKKHKIILSWDGVHGRDVMFPALPMDEKSDDTNIYSFDYQAERLGPFIRSLEVKLYRSDVYHVMDNSHRASFSTMQMTTDVDAVNTGGRAAINIQIGNHGLQTGIDHENIQKDGKRVGYMSMMGTTSKNTKNLWLDALIRNTGFLPNIRPFFHLMRYMVACGWIITRLPPGIPWRSSKMVSNILMRQVPNILI
jgi:iron complex outermembrane recepter protein